MTIFNFNLTNEIKFYSNISSLYTSGPQKIKMLGKLYSC